MDKKTGPITWHDLCDLSHDMVNAAVMCFGAAQLTAEQGPTPERLEFNERAEARMREVFDMADALIVRQKREERRMAWKQYAGHCSRFTGQIDPDRLAHAWHEAEPIMRNVVAGADVRCLLAEVLADRDYWKAKAESLEVECRATLAVDAT